ncbi:hypothetical protein [Hymenobacter koreensis]|uniref:Uncharacterized protein n=1 Tax=Hymenobacter koreensis TaxID=1084523 RepID=A0ABP8JKU7_9BACT
MTANQQLYDYDAAGYRLAGAEQMFIHLFCSGVAPLSDQQRANALVLINELHEKQRAAWKALAPVTRPAQAA